MTKTTAKTTDIILFAAPEDQKSKVDRIFLEVDVECICVPDTTSCLALIQKFRPIVVFIDFDLSETECRRICEGLAGTAEGSAIPVILLIDASELAAIDNHLLSSFRDVIFKPLRSQEVIGRLELVKKRLSQGKTKRMNEADRSIIRSARKACHELNQPLQYIMGSIQLALLDIAPEDPVYEMMNGFRQQSERMAQITANLMQLIRSIG